MNYFRKADKPDGAPGGAAASGGGEEPDDAAAAAAAPEDGAAQKDAVEGEGGAPPVLLPLDPPKGNAVEHGDDEDEHSDDEEGSHEEDSEGEYTDDSEYTYETDDEEDDKKKGGWFGFLRRGKGGAEEEDEEMTDESDHESEADAGEEERESSSDSDEEPPSHPLLDSAVASPFASPATVQKREAEEAALMAAAIQRVQRRIESKGGNLYEALEEKDKKLVDELRGVTDEEKIREAVAKSMEVEEGAKTSDDGGLGAEGMGEAQSPSVPEALVAPDLHADEPMVHAEPSIDLEPSLHADEPMLHAEPTADAEPVVLENGSNAQDAGAIAAEASGGRPGEEVEAQEAAEDEKETTDEEYDDEEDEEQPTVEEQRSLLSLAAEHDRVDVLQELLKGLSSEDPELFASLLEGMSHDETERGGDASFVPPPLHAAVAHGSSHAASCLLRMGADPSLRPVVPAVYLSHGYQPYRRSGSGAEEDRNYKKYHGMSAWELAFGSTVVVEGEDAAAMEKEADAGEEETAKGGGWFGFGSPKKEPEAPAAAPAATSQPRIKKKSPLNIPPAKLEGIQHAFTAEALRAIGSDEVGRLRQLLDAGMAPTTEAAGKTLAGWARELDAKGCRELLRADSADEGAAEEGVEEAMGEKLGAHGENGEGQTRPVPPPTNLQDERVAGMSLADVQALVRESQNLIPQLTACRDDLAAEASFNRSILKDVAATGGRGGLSSQSLIEVVRALKDRRAEAEDAAEAWQRAWEEREDELDFFWEEVLDDELRDELGGVLDGVSADLALPGAPVFAQDDATDGMKEWTKRFIEVDNYVTALRTSIASLAEESSRSMAEIEGLGLGGALSLTSSLREEVKEIEKHMALAQAGEALCRRKIEIIQQRLGHDPAAEENGDAPGENYHDEIPSPEGGVAGVNYRNEIPAPVDDDEIEDDEPEAPEPEQETKVVNDVVPNTKETKERERVNEDIGSDAEGSGSDVGGSSGVAADETNGIIGENQLEVENADNGENGEGFVEVQRPEATRGHDASGGGAVSIASVAPKANGQTDIKPSEAMKEGMSTAIVVHTPNPRASSLSSQLWEIIRRIVGLGPVRSNSYHDAENNPHIMIV